jgi:hypothetical protein
MGIFKWFCLKMPMNTALYLFERERTYVDLQALVRFCKV